MISFREYLKESSKEYFIVYLPGLKARMLESKYNRRYEFKHYIGHEINCIKEVAEDIESTNPKEANQIYNVVHSIKNILDQEPTIYFKIPTKAEDEAASEETISNWEAKINEELKNYPKTLFKKILFEVRKLDEIIKHINKKDGEFIEIRKNNIENYKDFI